MPILLAEVADCEVRDHIKPAQAAIGTKQYYYVKAGKRQRQGSKSRCLRAVAEGEIKDQQEWKIPPCISNWKNSKGYTIPLDKRLAADGRFAHIDPP